MADGLPSKFDIIEARLAELAERRPEVPLQDVVLLRAINHFSTGVLQNMRRAWLKPYGLTDWSFRTLVMLPRAGDGSPEAVSMADLSLITGESGPNMTRICDELVKRGLAVRKASPEDRRKVFLALTARGEALVDAAAPDMWGRLRWGMEIFTDDEKAAMTVFLKRLIERVEAEAGQGAPPRPKPVDAA
jgi:DNA-binding MarR family transcriptional regulator